MDRGDGSAAIAEGEVENENALPESGGLLNWHVRSESIATTTGCIGELGLIVLYVLRESGNETLSFM